MTKKEIEAYRRISVGVFDKHMGKVADFTAKFGTADNYLPTVQEYLDGGLKGIPFSNETAVKQTSFRLLIRKLALILGCSSDDAESLGWEFLRKQCRPEINGLFN
jgi:hypothetical protein